METWKQTWQAFFKIKLTFHEEKDRRHFQGWCGGFQFVSIMVKIKLAGNWPVAFSQPRIFLPGTNSF